MKAGLLILLNIGLLLGIGFAWNEVSSDDFDSDKYYQDPEPTSPDDEDTLLRESTQLDSTPEIQKKEFKKNETRDFEENETRLKPEKLKSHTKESQLIRKIKSGILIHQIQTEVDSEAIYTKFSIYQTEMKYQNILVEEDFHTLAETDAPIRSIAMAANHLLIQMQPGDLNQNLHEIFEDLEIQLEPTETPGLYRASFDGSDPIKFYETQQALQEAPGLKFSEPDYVISLD